MKNKKAPDIKISDLRKRRGELTKKYQDLEYEQEQYSRYEQIEYELMNIQDEIEAVEDAIETLKPKKKKP